MTNTTASVTATITEAAFGGGKNGNCDFVPPLPTAAPVLPAGLPWKLSVPGGLGFTIEGTDGQLIERPQFEEGPCIYSSKRLEADTPGAGSGEEEVFRMTSLDAPLKITNGCPVRHKRAAMPASWTITSEGEPVRLEIHTG